MIVFQEEEGNWTFHPFVSSLSIFPAYSVKTQAPGAIRLGVKRPGGKLTMEQKVHKSSGTGPYHR